jgi:hypothetical protein
MQHNDMLRSGQNLNETTLTTANVNVNQFGKLMTLPVDGLIYAQPLIVTDYLVNGARHDMVIVATMHNSVYAFDANTGALLWERLAIGPSVPSAAIGPINPTTGMPYATQNIQIEIGITATPVIDRTNGYIYLTRKDYTSSVQSYVAHVLSLATGADEPGSPVTIAASVPGPDGYGNQTVTFGAAYQLQRPALLLLRGTVYMAFSSHEDYPPYHGWILGYSYDANSGSLTQTQVFNVTPDGIEGGIWMSGQGLLSDGESVYALTANGSVTVQNGGKSYGEAFLKLTPDLAVSDWFVPVEWELLNAHDIDLGAGGPLLIPGTNPLLMSGGGKEGKMYVVDTTRMGHLGTVDDENTQEFFVSPSNAGGNTVGPIYGSPVIWTGGAAPRLFVWAVGDVMKAFDLHDGLFDTTPITGPIANVSIGGQDPVGSLSVSSNGSMDGTGIVWATRPFTPGVDANHQPDPDHFTVPGVFYAFDARTLTELWDSTQNMARDNMGRYAKFVPPTVANGKVYLASCELPGPTPSAVYVYGLLHPKAGDAGTGDAATDAPTTADAPADAPVADAGTDGPPPFTIDAGITWSSLYRDYFGPTGRASCAGTGSCHGTSSGQGAEVSSFLCPSGDGGVKACWASMTSRGANGADLLTPDASFSASSLDSVLCQQGGGFMPAGGTLAGGCAYIFSPTDLDRLEDWFNAGALEN